MMDRRQFVVGAVASVIALASGVYIGIAVQGGDRLRDPSMLERLPSRDAVATFFTAHLNDLNGKMVPLSEWKGKTLVINFWATGCPPCREEMPALSRLQTKYSRNGVQFVGIALNSTDNVVDYSKQHPVSYPLLVADSLGEELSQRLGNSLLRLPYTLVLDAEGATRMTKMGAISEQELDALLQNIVTIQ